jgi:transposase
MRVGRGVHAALCDGLEGPVDGPGFDDREWRAVDLIEAFPNAVEQISPAEWRVRSSSGHGFYRVRLDHENWICECPDWAERLKPCKHAYAVTRSRTPKPAALVEITTESAGPLRDWRAQDQGQQAEHVFFDELLWDLLGAVDEPVRPVGAPGRMPIPLRTQLFLAVKKVHFGQSCRRVNGLMRTVHGPDRGGTLASVPNYTIPSRLFNREDAGDLLLRLIEGSARPLAELEDGGTVAIDSTGFCTTCMGAYCTEKHDPTRRHRWVKAHLIIGTRTHAVLGVAVTDERGADSPQLIPLLRNVVEAGFKPSALVADKAYLSRAAYAELARLGMDGYIPFRIGTTGQMKGTPMYRRKWLEFTLKREEFDAKYHRRSNVESVNSAIKRTCGEFLFSKNPEAQFNETLAKILTYNIRVLIHEIYENGIDPGLGGTARNRPEGAPPPFPPTESGAPCDSFGDPVMESGDSAAAP